MKLVWLLFAWTAIACTPAPPPPAATVSVAQVTPPPDTSFQLQMPSGVRAVLHDTQGNYWFGGHHEGAARFDGATYTYFTTAEGLPGNQVRSIYETADGTIWLGTNGGVASYDDAGLHDHSGRTPGTLGPLPGRWALDPADLYFNGAGQSGVFRYDGSDLTYLTFPVSFTADDPATYYQMTATSEAPDGTRWIATYGAAFGFDGEDFTIYDNQKLGFDQEGEYLHIRSILADSQGRLWIGNNGIGVLLVENGEAINFSEQQGVLNRISYRAGLPDMRPTLRHVFAIGEDQRGHIYFGDRDTGAWRFDGTTLEQVPFQPVPDNPHIWQFYADPNGDFLATTASGAVYQLVGEGFVREF